MIHKSIEQWIADLKSLDVQLWIEGEQETPLDKIRLRCTAPEGILTSQS
jgi:hypothetical protein